MANEFRASELAECAEREVKQRKRVYPRRITEGRMTQSLAERQIAMMEAIAAHYRSMARKEEDLFG